MLGKTLFVLAVGLAAAANSEPLARRPTIVRVSPKEAPPALSDALAVALSPLEPVLPGEPELTPSASTRSSENHAPSTRSAQLDELFQHQDKTSTTIAVDSIGLGDPSSQNPASGSEQAVSGAGSSTTEMPREATTTLAPSADTDSTGQPEAEEPTTQGTSVAVAQPAENSESVVPEVASSPAPNSSTTSDVVVSSTTEATPSEEPAITTTTTTTTVAPAANEAPDAQPAPEAPAAPSTGADQSEPSEPSKPAEEPTSGANEAPTYAPVTTTTVEPASSSTTPEPEAPTRTTTPPPTEAATTTSTTTTTTTAPAPLETSSERPKMDEAKPEATEPKDKDKDTELKQTTSCNHLPSYEPDELQKVFREETTYKNGTIKGKFTYINFDGRYRLVHYTRLPYGPVKIDQVEELSRPDQPPTAGSNASDRDSVLQLRNILPDSLYGFPFLNARPSPNPNPSSLDASHGRGPVNVGYPALQDNSPSVSHNNNNQNSPDKSSMFFYSTEPVSTPNLPLRPNAPVSVVNPNRRLNSFQASAAPSHREDTLTQSLNDEIQVSAGGQRQHQLSQQVVHQQPQQQPPQPQQLQQQVVDESPQPPSSFAQPQPQQQFQPQPFAFQTLHDAHLSQAPSIYGYQQPQMMFGPQLVGLAPAYHQQQQIQHQIAEEEPPRSPYQDQYQQQQQHQYNHRAQFEGPFALIQAPSPSLYGYIADQSESARLRLKVKPARLTDTGAAPNHQDDNNSNNRFAQLRMSPVDGSTPPEVVESRPGMQLAASSALGHSQRQQRHRSGKQNHELSKPLSNKNPVVYHIRAKIPSGMRSFSGQQDFSMAYDS